MKNKSVNRFIKIFSGIGIVMLIIGYRETFKLKRTEYVIKGPKVTDDMDGKKIVFFSDFHNANDGRQNKRIAKLINRENPEFILCGGDMLVGRVNKSIKPSADLINRLTENNKVYMIPGNHELRIESNPKRYSDNLEKFLSEVKSDNFFYIKDETKTAKIGDTSVNITGLDLDFKYYDRHKVSVMPLEYLTSKLGNADENTYNILLAHNPEYFDLYSAWGADLTFSGHYHGGIMILPKLGGVISPRLKLFPKFFRGIYESEDNKKKMVLSSGLGQHSIKLRFFNPPEYVVIRFSK